MWPIIIVIIVCLLIGSSSDKKEQVRRKQEEQEQSIIKLNMQVSKLNVVVYELEKENEKIRTMLQHIEHRGSIDGVTIQGVTRGEKSTLAKTTAEKEEAIPLLMNDERKVVQSTKGLDENKEEVESSVARVASNELSTKGEKAIFLESIGIKEVTMPSEGNELIDINIIEPFEESNLKDIDVTMPSQENDLKDIDIVLDTRKLVTPNKPIFKIKSENWVGINLLNRLGALLIVIGAISAANLAILPPVIRSLILFVFALSVIVIGEVMNRKKPTIASMGVTAVGIALLYVAVAMSYFGLQILSMYSALIACIVATGLGVYLAIRYDEQVIGCFALIGGYLPILAVDPFNNILTIGIIVYFLILSIYSLSIALARKWMIMNVIGFVLTIIGTVYLGRAAEPVTALLYACFAFFLYIILPLITAYRTKETFNEFDVTFASINAFVSSTIIFLIADRLSVMHMHGYLSLIFAGIYIGLAHFIRKNLEHQNMEMIFKLTSIAFTILFVPFYFDAQWFAIAWLIEAVVIATYGILREKKISEFIGLGLLGFSVISLIAYNLLFNIQFTFNYTFFTIMTFVVLGVYIYKARHHWAHAQAYKIGVLANLWLFVMYVWFTYAHIKDFNVLMMLAILITLGLSAIYVKAKIISDAGTRIFANIMHRTSILALWVANITFSISSAMSYSSDSSAMPLILNLIITILLTAMIVYYKVKEEPDNKLIRRYKTSNLVNLWLSSSFIIFHLVDHWLSHIIYISEYTVIAVTLLLCVLYLKSKILVNNGTRILVNIMHASVLVVLWDLSYEITLWFFTGSPHVHLVLSLIFLFVAFAMVIYYKVKEINSKWFKIYKNINIVNLWLFTLFIIASLLQNFAGYHIILILITFVGALLITKIPIISDEQTTIISIVMHIVGLVWLAVFNASTYQPFFVWLFLNFTTQMVALFSLNDLIKLVTTKPKGEKSPYKLLIIFTYFMFIVTQGLMVQGDVGFNSGLISIIYVIAAFASIVLGFKLKNMVMRKTGLYLSITSVAKLLIVDTTGLSTEMRIVSYLTLGIVLMLISFVYQKFSRKFDDDQA